jgi:hypothetical protein
MRKILRRFSTFHNNSETVTGLAVVLFAASCLCFGCERAHTSSVDVFDLPATEVLVNVDGQKITAGDYVRRLDLECAVYRYMNRTKPANQLDSLVARFKESRVSVVLPELINQRLVKEYLQANGVADDSQKIQTELKACLKKFAHKGDLASFSKLLKVDARYLEDQLLVPYRVSVARQIYNKGAITVTEKEIDEGLERQNKYYDFATKSNAVTYVTASNVLKQIRSGMDFVEAGKKYGAYLPEEAEFWEKMEKHEIENKEMKAWAFSAPVGSIGGPYDLDDGLSIVKILGREDGAEYDSLVAEKVGEVSLSRITFYMLVPEPEPRTRDFVRRSLLRWKNNQVQKKLFEHLHKTTRIKYPRGTNFTFKGGTK